jgi:hypothetical protein
MGGRGMKRYWKLVVILLVVVLSIGTFYIQSAVSANQLPQIIIEKQIGSEKEAVGLSINASYSDGAFNDNLKISSKGSKYNSEMSFFDRMKKDGFHSNELQELQDKHHSFMRGKNDSYGFYENRNHLVYATIHYKAAEVGGVIGNGNYSFEIASFNKENKNQSLFSISVPKQYRFSSVYVNDVQMINNQLIVITTNNVTNHDQTDINDSEIHTYHFEIAQKKLISDETILKNPNLNDHMGSNYNMIQENEMSKPSQYIFFNHVLTKYSTQEEGSISSNDVKIELLAYNYKTKKEETIKLSKELKGSDPQISNGSILYLTEHNSKGITIIAYNAEKKKIENEYEIPLPHVERDANNFLLKNKRNKLYFLTPYSDSQKSASLYIFNEQTKAALYEGTVTKKNKDKKNFSLNLYDLQVVK